MMAALIPADEGMVEYTPPVPDPSWTRRG